ncbi:putative RNA-binding protein 42 [Monocercomonoides exilis]|uniref:putative RNA-binding protein 42 n=1 Tax=Monocercomonoides exilis TaxID=2049356 RepID=UPI00355ABB8E|nr:putative RNA-binding protein 42 [Monocercomonoides exilis]|eukprot:MONOS_3498.1-p1 / transcript=MONOS_3498.1 / gene=MONOS_3498 / organism=Monocercomonoides_exilis_PA203 / gene_product=Protein TAG-262 / transcript_product=Protein TAG-262 / location=Mono_scaffold00083:11908-12496(+) / protein_length=156 / sequence_SO=supercontig / SO=protein_coding / is_pseudo=false
MSSYKQSSKYLPKDERGATSTVSSEQNVLEEQKAVKKKTLRYAGGKVWEDKSMLEWDDDDYRMWCGDLGPEVTEETLSQAFSIYPSFQKAKVIRDFRTKKSKGYGFLSFKDSEDYLRAFREMNGKYVGSRPVRLRKSNWRARQYEVGKKKDDRILV